jgi:hypothetical protein
MRDDIKIYLKETKWKSVNYTYQAQDSDRFLAVVNRIILRF